MMPESDIPIPVVAVVDAACAALGLSASKPTGQWIADTLADGIEAGQWDTRWGRE